MAGCEIFCDLKDGGYMLWELLLQRAALKQWRHSCELLDAGARDSDSERDNMEGRRSQVRFSRLGFRNVRRESLSSFSVASGDCDGMESRPSFATCRNNRQSLFSMASNMSDEEIRRNGLRALDLADQMGRFLTITQRVANAAEVTLAWAAVVQQRRLKLRVADRFVSMQEAQHSRSVRQAVFHSWKSTKIRRSSEDSVSCEDIPGEQVPALVQLAEEPGEEKIEDSCGEGLTAHVRTIPTSNHRGRMVPSSNGTHVQETTGESSAPASASASSGRERGGESRSDAPSKAWSTWFQGNR